ncbi:HD-GYP domain-containing protein (c-di-GMP phosphodiesterase class II) [Actimicrobium sp. GrIS 1.19]|uniref:HD-GYP domain-containing protein n=1 Tax=Actimicrobium sp. GrIS 1.19 TaxID=3071708 RepID=UPI002E0C6C24|nr:HD-GYP domain-containing protein (c-di-GMP phosphodiesterase class II) [Actimicrobium sp. GrIS 1.19]
MPEQQSATSQASVNPHYLSKVMELSENMDVEASEDILDARGNKLIARGARISRNMQERLILHKLRKPLESCMTITGGMNVNAVVSEARRLLDTNEPLGYILKASDGAGMSPFELLESIPIGSVMRMMLTITDRVGPAAFSHCVMVSMIAIALARKSGMAQKEQMVAAIGGLLHDIGELYIEPEYLRSGKRLLPHEWRHVVVHPRIGQLLISELETYPAAVGIAVSEHHERFDGAGYPRRLSGARISPVGQILAVAEMIGGLLMQKENPLRRAELALKIIPSEHAHPLISVVSKALRLSQTTPTDAINMMSSPEASERIRTLLDYIPVIIKTAGQMAELPELASTEAKHLLAQTIYRIAKIERAFSSTGLEMYARDGQVHSGEILFELIVATKEIQWRLRDVARDLALNSSSFAAVESAALAPLIAMLDASPDAHPAAPVH